MQLLVRGHHLHGPQVDGAQDHLVFLRRLHIHLQRRLSVQFDGNVHHITPLHQAVGRGIRPTPCQIHTHRASSPHNLVLVHRKLRMLAEIHRAHQSVAHQRKRPVLYRFHNLRRFPIQLQGPCTEHRITDTRKQGSRLIQFRRQFQSQTAVLLRRLLQVQLVEHTLSVILRQRLPVHLAELLTLRGQSSQVGIRRDFVRRPLLRLQPYILSLFQFRFRRHPSQHRTQILHRFAHREDCCRLQVLISSDFLRLHSAGLQPFRRRYTLIQRALLVQRPLERIVESVRSSHKTPFTHRHHVDADPFGHLHLPCVAGHTGNDVSAVQFPFLSHVAVLDPHLRIFRSQPAFHLRVLHEDSRMRFHLMMHDGPLVHHTVLHGECRGDHLPARTIVVELPARQRQNRHLQLRQLLVVQTRMRSQCRSEVRVHIIESNLSILFRTLHHQFHSPVAQQPDADVHQEKIILHQSSQLLHTWLLQHEVQVVRLLSRGNKHPVVLRQLRVHPQSVAHHVRIRNLLQRFRRTDIHIPACHQRMQPFRSLFHNPFVKRQLQREQVLCQFLAASPAEHGNRRKNLP